MEKLLIEVSWEVANKVGGIHTVLKEKADYITREFKNSYLVIGPYLEDKSHYEFSFLIPPSEFKEVISECNKYGFTAVYGEWLIGARPKGFLIEFKNFLNNVNPLKYELWAKYRIDSLRTGDDYNYPIAWSKAVSLFLKILEEHFPSTKKVLHLHEWLSGAIILFEDLPTYKKIFTTHATILGRAIAGSGQNVWDVLQTINPDEEAYKYVVEAKHKIEKLVANKVNYFTVVSNVLANEAQYILGRKPDFILPNGINLSKYPTLEEITYAHRKSRDTIKDFLLYFFTPYYSIDTKKSLIFFTSGRYEVRNKGIDIFIRALGELNKKLKENDPTIFAFIFVPSNPKGVNQVIFSNLNIYRHLEDVIEDLGEEIKSRLINYLIHKEGVGPEDILTKSEYMELKKIVKNVQTTEEYPISTHIIDDDITKIIKAVNLLNKPQDKVKVIYYPIYLKSADGFLNLDYEDAIVGCHAGFFLSFYEPWGYTALESAANGVITVTTDLTGFADYVSKITNLNLENQGLYIVSRKGRRDADVVEDVSNIMLKIAKLSRADRVQNRIEIRRIASYCSWDNLIKNYLDLYNVAFS
jgi:glycogen(starch) synthase